MANNLRDLIARRLDELAPTRGSDFQSCANALLRKEYQTLSPGPTGPDGGRDGEAARAPGGAGVDLVCTIANDPSSNLRRSLESAKKQGRPIQRVVFATSRALGQKARDSLRAIANGLGAELVNIYDRQWFVDSLTRDSHWRVALLAIPGDPPALSKTPRETRPSRSAKAIGRDADLAWLRETPGDLVLAGQPGSGKTLLLRLLAAEGAGSFVVDSNRARLLDAIGDQRPPRLFIDDARSDLGLLHDLVRLRADGTLPQQLSFVATCWPPDADALMTALGGLPPSQLRRLEPLHRREIAEIYRAAGITAPDEALRWLIDCADGLPGLAVAIAEAVRGGELARIADGTLHAQELLSRLAELVGSTNRAWLATIALGGEAGVSLEAVAASVGLSRDEVFSRATRLDTGGILRTESGGYVAIRTEPLRVALVREVFLSPDRPALDWRPLLERVASRPAAAAMLVAAALSGPTRLDRDSLRHLVQSECADPSAASARAVWRRISADRDHCRWALEHYPGPRHQLAASALAHPEEALPILLQGMDARTKVALLDWAMGEQSGVERRVQLAVYAAERLNTEFEPASAEVLFGTLGLRHTDHSQHPVEDRAYNLRLRHFGANTVAEIANRVWPLVRQAVVPHLAEAWPFLSSVLWEWAHPLAPTAAGNAEEARKTSAERTRLRSMLGDLLTESTDPAVRHGIAALGDSAGISDLAPARNEAERLERLFIAGDSPELEKLADGWASQPPAEISARIAQLADRARLALTPSRLSPRVSRLVARLADRVSEPREWLNAFLREPSTMRFAGRFLKPLEPGAAGWNDAWSRAMEGPDATRFEALSAALAEATLEPAIEQRLQQALADQSQGWIPELAHTMALRGELPESRALDLLQAPWTELAWQTAIGEWSADPPGSVRSSLQAAWEQAILRVAESDNLGSHQGYWLGTILSTAPELAIEWLVRWYGLPDRWFDEEDDLARVIEQLPVNCRQVLLSRLSLDCPPPGLVAAIVDGEPDLFEEALRRTKDWPSLEALQRFPDSSWLTMLRSALEAGVGIDRLGAIPLPLVAESIQVAAALDDLVADERDPRLLQVLKRLREGLPKVGDG